MLFKIWPLIETNLNFSDLWPLTTGQTKRSDLWLTLHEHFLMVDTDQHTGMYNQIWVPAVIVFNI